MLSWEATRIGIIKKSVIITIVVFPSIAGTPSVNEQVKGITVKARNGKDLIERTSAAEQLASLTRRINPILVDDSTIKDIIALLDTDEDSVRFWVAGALGNIGPRASVAIPKLLELLRKVDCLPGSVTSAPAIRMALKKMGKMVPPPSYELEKK